MLGPFTYVNCGAIPDELFESSFFGHVKGAFTGAIRDAEGFLTKADQGTLFLDEIAELSPRAQSKLLQALSDKTYTPVGSTRELLSNFRLIVATNRNLEDMVRAGTFREDLFYRVNVLDVTLPPLRMRKDDIPLLVNAILRRNGISFTPSSTVLKKLYTHSWPGNIRELENVIMRYAAERSLEFFHPVPVKGREETRTPGMPEEREDAPLKEQLARAEKNAIAQALQKNCWNRQRTADALGITEPAIYRHFKNKSEIVKTMIARFDQAVSAEDRELHGFDAVAAFARRRFEQVTAAPPLARVMFAEELFMDDEEFTELVFRMMHRHKAALEHSFREAQENGEIRRDIPSDTLFRLVFGPVRLLIKQWGMTRGAFDLHQKGEELLSTLRTILR